MKQFIQFQWNRFIAWLRRVEELQRRVEVKDNELIKLRAEVNSLRWELELSRGLAKQVEQENRKATQSLELLARWIKTTHRLGHTPADGSIQQLLQNAR